jgi:hypothetical protein
MFARIDPICHPLSETALNGTRGEMVLTLRNYLIECIATKVYYYDSGIVACLVLLHFGVRFQIIFPLVGSIINVNQVLKL